MLKGETEATLLDPIDEEVEFVIWKVPEFLQESEEGPSMVEGDTGLIGPVLGLGISRQHLEVP